MTIYIFFILTPSRVMADSFLHWNRMATVASPEEPRGCDKAVSTKRHRSRWFWIPSHQLYWPPLWCPHPPLTRQDHPRRVSTKSLRWWLEALWCHRRGTHGWQPTEVWLESHHRYKLDIFTFSPKYLFEKSISILSKFGGMVYIKMAIISTKLINELYLRLDPVPCPWRPRRKTRHPPQVLRWLQSTPSEIWQCYGCHPIQGPSFYGPRALPLLTC